MGYRNGIIRPKSYFWREVGASSGQTEIISDTFYIFVYFLSVYRHRLPAHTAPASSISGVEMV